MKYRTVKTYQIYFNHLYLQLTFPKMIEIYYDKIQLIAETEGRICCVAKDPALLSKPPESQPFADTGNTIKTL